MDARRSRRLPSSTPMHRLRGDRVGRAAVRVPVPATVRRGRRNAPAAWHSTSGSCAKISSSTSKSIRSTRSTRSPRRYEGHALTEVKVTPRRRRGGPGRDDGRPDRPAAGLAGRLLLEPRSEDGLTTWNFFDEGLEAGADFPVLRLPQPPDDDLTDRPAPRGPADAISRSRSMSMRGRPGAADRLAAGRCRPPGSTEQPGSRPARPTRRVDAATGRSKPFFDPNVLAKARGRGWHRRARTRGRSRGGGRSNGPDHEGFVFTHADDLFYATFDGNEASPLTSSPSERSGRVQPRRPVRPFIRDYDLHVVDLATQTERP